MAIDVNRPTRIVLNHLDYICSPMVTNRSKIINDFIFTIENNINRKIDFWGFGPSHLQKNELILKRTRIERFKDIEEWQLARELTRNVNERKVTLNDEL